MVRHLHTTVSDREKDALISNLLLRCGVGSEGLSKGSKVIETKNSAQDVYLPTRNQEKLVTEDQLQKESISP